MYLVSLRTKGQWRKAMFTKRFSRNTLFIFFVGPTPGRKSIQWDKRKVSLDLYSFRKASKTLWTKNFFHIFVLIAGPKKVIQKVLLNQVIVIFNTIWVQRKSFTQLQKAHLISIFTQGLWKVALVTVTHYQDLKLILPIVLFALCYWKKSLNTSFCEHDSIIRWISSWPKKPHNLSMSISDLTELTFNVSHIY